MYICSSFCTLLRLKKPHFWVKIRRAIRRGLGVKFCDRKKKKCYMFVKFYISILVSLLSFPSNVWQIAAEPHDFSWKIVHMFYLVSTLCEALRQIVSVRAFALTNRPIRPPNVVRLNRTASSMLSFAPLCAVSLDKEAENPTRTRRNSYFFVVTLNYFFICLFLAFFSH